MSITNECLARVCLTVSPLNPHGYHFCSCIIWVTTGASRVALMVKNPPANAGDVRDMGSIPGLRVSLEEGMATHFSILVWRIPWTEESSRLQSIGLYRVRHDWSYLTSTHSQQVSKSLHWLPPENRVCFLLVKTAIHLHYLFNFASGPWFIS